MTIRRLILAAGLLALWSQAARAQVLEIGADGEVATYAGPAVFTADGVAPILPAPGAAGRLAASRGEVAQAIDEAARRYAVPASLARAVAWRESRFLQTAVSPKGAIGVMQLMPGSARDLGVDPFDLRQNIQGGVAYLGRMLARYRGDAGLALAAYNAGPGAVDRLGMPPFQETRRYVSAILAGLPDPSAILQPVLAPAFVLSSR